MIFIIISFVFSFRDIFIPLYGFVIWLNYSLQLLTFSCL